MPAFVAPYTYVPDPTADRSLFLGEAYFGLPNTDPLIPDNQITVRKVENDGTFTDLAQPITVGLGGVIMVDGSPAQLDIVETNYAVLIRDRQDVQTYSFPSAGPGGTSGREVLISQGGLPFDATLLTTGPSLVINPLIHTNALILCDTSGGDVTLNLPSAALTGDRFRFYAKKMTADGNVVSLTPDGTDTIDGGGYQIQERWETVEIVCNGIDWFVLTDHLNNHGARLRTVETRSSTNQTNIQTLQTDVSTLQEPPRVFAAGHTEASGALTWGHNLTVARPSTGAYNYTFDNNLPSGTGDDVAIHVSVTSSQRFFLISSNSISGFTVNTVLYQVPDTISNVNQEHFVTVFAPNSSFS